MKRIRLKIAFTMIISLCLVFTGFIFIFIYSFNNYFQNEAVNRLKQEQSYSQYTSGQAYLIHTYGSATDENIEIYEEDSEEYDENNGEVYIEYYDEDDDEEYIDDVENEDDADEESYSYYVSTGNLFYDTIQYIYTDEFYQQLNKEPNIDVLNQKETDRILAYCTANKDALSDGEIIQLKNENAHYIIAQTTEKYVADDDTFNTVISIMYIDIHPIENLSYRFIKISVIVLCIIAVIMYFVGMLLGRKIEKEQAQQTTFFQNASHELKTPLMSIQGYAEGIQTGVIDSGKAVKVILSESERMAELVEEILCISKLESSQSKIKKEPFDIKELLYDCLRSVEAVLNKNAITPTVDFDESIIIINGDEGQLRKAFLNLLSNAIRYAEKEIKIQCREQRSHICISVTDDGKGISDDTLKHIFERFYIGPNGNTGIGLALTKEIILHHNGQIKAHNTPYGACFSVTLPKK